jgi:hypothetical protein
MIDKYNTFLSVLALNQLSENKKLIVKSGRQMK